MTLEPRQKDLWLRELQLNGFAVLREFVPPDLVRSMHDQILPIVRGEYERARRGEAPSLRGPARISFDIRRYLDLLGGPLADERFLTNPAIEELVDAILGASRWVRGWTRVECAFAGSEHMGWHSDQTLEDTPDPEIYSGSLRLTYNIPLVDFTSENGAMELIPGSHRLPRSFLSADFTQLPNLYPARLILRRGDAVLRDGNTLHRGTPNRTAEPRPMLDQTYKAEKETRDHSFSRRKAPYRRRS